MLDDKPLVSVCIPAFNCGRYVGNTLRCLCAQTYASMEIIVVNDGSTDDTLSIIQKIKDSRIKTINSDNGGAARARNIACAQASGRYIIFFDADDYVPPDFISQQIEKAASRKDIVVLSAWGRFYQDDLDTFRPDELPDGDMTFAGWIKQYWYKANPMTSPGRALIPAEIIKKAGLWNEALSLNDDLDFFTRVFMAARQIVFNNKAVFYYRSGVNGLSGKKDKAAYLSLFNSIQCAVDQASSAYRDDSMVLKSCANMWQSFIYEVYPKHPELTQKAQAYIDGAGGSNLPFPAGKLTGLLVRLTGWKIAKRLKTLFY